MSGNDNDPKLFSVNEKIKLDDELNNNNNIKNDNLNSNDLKKNFINIKSSTSEITHSSALLCKTLRC